MYRRQSPWDFYSLVMACKWHSVSVRQPNSGLVYETNFLKNLGKMWYFSFYVWNSHLFLLLEDFQGKHSQTHGRTVLFPVAAPLQNLSSVGRVAMGTQRAPNPYPRTPHEHLTELSVPRILLQSPASGRRQGRDALDCTADDPFSLSFIQDTWEIRYGWLLKNQKIGILLIAFRADF